MIPSQCVAEEYAPLFWETNIGDVVRFYSTELLAHKDRKKEMKTPVMVAGIVTYIDRKLDAIKLEMVVPSDGSEHVRRIMDVGSLFVYYGKDITDYEILAKAEPRE